MASSLSRAAGDLVPNIEPLRGGLSLMAGATAGALIDLVSGAIKTKATPSTGMGKVLPFVIALGESAIAVWVIDMSGDYMRPSNALFFTLGTVLNLQILQTWGDVVALAAYGQV